MTSLIKQNKRLFLFCSGFLVVFVLNCLISFFTDMGIGYDNLYYWHLFEPLSDSKPIELWRGYFFPFYLFLLNKTASGSYALFIVINSLINAFMFMYIIPFISMGRIDINLATVSKNIANYFVALFFFRGLFVYTLSDAYALYMCFLSVFFYIKFKNAENSAKSLLYVFLCGIFIYLAYNIRTIYLFSGIACFAMLIFSIHKARNLKKQNAVAGVFALLLGIFVSALPQGILNYKYHKIISPMIPTQSQLFWQECVWGMEYQRYDTYAGHFFYNDVEQEHAQMYFTEPVGVRLLEEAKKIKNDSGSNFKAALYIVQHPFEMLGIYFRHFANLLFPCWPNQYIMRINNNKAACAVLSLTIIYLFALSLAFRAFYRGAFFLSFLPALVACLFIIPGAVESRFFLSVFLFMSSGLLYNTDATAMWIKTKQNAVVVVLIFLFFSAAMISQWTLFLNSETEIPIYMLGR